MEVKRETQKDVKIVVSGELLCVLAVNGYVTGIPDAW